MTRYFLIIRRNTEKIKNDSKRHEVTKRPSTYGRHDVSRTVQHEKRQLSIGS